MATPISPARTSAQCRQTTARGTATGASVDSPWIHAVETSMFARSVQGIRALNPTWILSSHLPPATGDMTRLLDTLLEAPSADVFTGPDQAALEAMLRQFEPV